VSCGMREMKKGVVSSRSLRDRFNIHPRVINLGAAKLEIRSMKISC
jgi:hypothetical protein